MHAYIYIYGDFVSSVVVVEMFSGSDIGAFRRGGSGFAAHDHHVDARAAGGEAHVRGRAAVYDA
jgi:hypothetical protein